MTRLVRLCGWIIAIGSLWFFVRTWLAPDACLDFGGSFNYERWECNDEVNQYVAVRFYELKSFWLFVVTVAVASLLQWKWRRAIQIKLG